MSLDEVIFYPKLNLSASEMRAVKLLHTFFDVENVSLYFLGKPMTAYGSLTHRELKEKILDENLPLPGIQKFFSLYPAQEDREKNALKVIRLFLEEASPSRPSFIHNYFHLEPTFRLITAHLRAQSMGIKTEEKRWPELYDELLTIWKDRSKKARELDRALLKWKFQAMEELCANSPPFSLDFFLSYLIRLRIIEAQVELDDPIHLNIIERIAKASR